MNTHFNKDEKQLVGGYAIINGRVESDQITERINYLTENVLVRLGFSEDGWDILYQDKNDGRYWELTFPQSALHGGGPPTLTLLNEETLKSKYWL